MWQSQGILHGYVVTYARIVDMLRITKKFALQYEVNFAMPLDFSLNDILHCNAQAYELLGLLVRAFQCAPLSFNVLVATFKNNRDTRGSLKKIFTPMTEIALWRSSKVYKHYTRRHSL